MEYETEVAPPLSISLYNDFLENNYLINAIAAFEHISAETLSDLTDTDLEEIYSTLDRFETYGLVNIGETQSQSDYGFQTASYSIRQDYFQLLSQLSKRDLELLGDFKSREVFNHISEGSLIFGIYYNIPENIADDVKLPIEKTNDIINSLVFDKLVLYQEEIFSSFFGDFCFEVIKLTEKGQDVKKIDTELKRLLVLDREDSSVKRYLVNHSDWYMLREAEKFNV